MSPQWHLDLTCWDKTPVPRDLDAVGERSGTQQSDAQIYYRTLADFLFIKLGRPRWFLNSDLTGVLLHSKIEGQSLQGVTFPYDSFHLVFENGIKLADGYELKFVSVCNPRSSLAAKLGGVAMQEFGSRFNNHPFEESFFVGAYILRNGKTFESLSVLPLSMPIRDGIDIVNSAENKTGQNPDVLTDSNDQVIKITVAAIFYYNARPDLFVPHTLGRDQRYRFSGDADDRNNMRRLVLPTVKKVTADHATAGVGSTKRPHYRGFVLRTLRDERYARNPDGTFRTVLVEPTAKGRGKS